MEQFSHLQFELKTERLILRPLKISDAELLWPHVSDPDIPKYMCWEVHQNMERTRDFLKSVEEDFKNEEGIHWGIFQNDIFCGLIGVEIIRKIHDTVLDRGELGYWLGKEFWGQGIIPEAARTVIPFLFKQLKLHKITTAHFEENSRSQRVIEKLGFRLIGNQKQHFFKNGKWQDNKIYEMLESECRFF